jgi:hypothetical protein
MHTKTPRTDAVEYSNLRVKPERFVVDADFARDLERENEDAREALALAHAILAKLPPRDVVHASKRAAIKHVGNAPMAYIAGVLANAKIRDAGGRAAPPL